MAIMEHIEEGKSFRGCDDEHGRSAYPVGDDAAFAVGAQKAQPGEGWGGSVREVERLVDVRAGCLTSS